MCYIFLVVLCTGCCEHIEKGIVGKVSGAAELAEGIGKIKHQYGLLLTIGIYCLILYYKQDR